MAIQILSTQLVNKIAAGEVVERPASVVKELVENALDAGARRIDVTVEHGGRGLVAVSDDGAGMSAEDLALAFTSHATSKINDADDLFGISTMGFRGEALASIASISHAHIRTRRRDDDGGHEVNAAGDTIGDVRPCAAAGGTTISVRDLFFNTPARRKFLRTVNTEMGHIAEQITRLALPHPDVAFTLTHNGREVQNLPATDTTARRIRDVFREELASSLLPIRTRTGQIHVAGLIAPPAATRAASKWQYFFLNGRYIRDRLLAHALREAYRGLIEPSRFPVAFVFMEIDPAEVDVNVHPTKIEVRFRDGQLVHGELLAALRETLNQANLSPAATFSEPAELADAPGDDDKADDRRNSLRQALADFFKSAPPTQPRFSFPESQFQPPAKDSSPGKSAFDASPLARAPQVADRPDAPPIAPQAERTPEPPSEPSPRRAMQIHDSYIVTENAEGLVIIDQHALHERLLYNEFKRRLAGDDGALTAQRMLIPETLTVTASEAALLEERGELLRRLGIEVNAFGASSVAIQQFPGILAQRGVAPKAFLRELIDRLGADETTDPERLLEDLLEMLACKAAVKAGNRLTDEEIEALLRECERAEKNSSCPHGRPTTLRLTLKDLEKQFKRT